MNQLAFINQDGEALKQEGMQLAADKADRVEPNWTETAREYLESFLKSWEHDEFTGEQAQWWMLKNGLNEPASCNAWGSVFNKAARDGLIVKTEKCRNSLKASARARLIPVWRKS